MATDIISLVLLALLNAVIGSITAGIYRLCQENLADGLDKAEAVRILQQAGFGAFYGVLVVIVTWTFIGWIILEHPWIGVTLIATIAPILGGSDLTILIKNKIKQLLAPKTPEEKEAYIKELEKHLKEKDRQIDALTDQVDDLLNGQPIDLEKLKSVEPSEDKSEEI